MVSLKVAKDVYGVVINKAKMTIDQTKTKALRAKIKEKDIGLIFGTHYIAEDIFKEFEISFDSGVI